MRIMRFHTLIGFTIFGFFIHCGLADISLTLRNRALNHNSGRGFGRNRKSYLPPPVQPIQHNAEEYFSIQQDGPHHQHQHQPQQKFHESNYGNARYQIFEVHNHYEPGSKHNGAAPQAIVHIKHINSGVIPSPHHESNDDHLDISYLSFAANEGQNGEQITIREQLPPPPPPPQPLLPPAPLAAQVAPTVPVPFPSNYQHDFQTTNNAASHGQRQGKQVLHGSKSFTTTGYLPPNREAARPDALPYKGPDYLPPYKQEQSVSSDGRANFRAPDYLPPHQSPPPAAQHPLTAQIPTQHQQQPQSIHNINQHNDYKGPDYLPPHPSQPAQTPVNNAAYHGSINAKAINDAYRGPDYLPPPQGGNTVQLPQPPISNFQQQQNLQHFEQNHQQQHQRQQSPAVSSIFKAPDYLPPNQEPTIQQPLSPQPFRAPDYSPPQQGPQIQQHLPSQQYKAPDYLPPHATPNGAVPLGNTERQPGALPAGYDFDNPEEKQQVQQQQQQQQQQQPQQQHFDQQVQIQQSPPQYQEHLQAIPPPSLPAPTQGTLATPGALPPGYEFNKPDNAEQAIAELHGLAPPSQPQEQLQQQQATQSNYQTYQQNQYVAQQQQSLPPQPTQQHQLPQQSLPQQHLQQQPLTQQPLQQQPVQQQPLQQQSLQQQPLQQQHFAHPPAQQQQHHEVVVQSQIQVASNHAPEPDVVYGQPNIAAPPEARSSYQADPSGYLPPHVETPLPQQHAAPAVVQYAATPANAPQYQQPQIPIQQQVAPAAVQYAATPANAPQYQQPQIQQHVQQYNVAPQQQHIHSLSSFMTTVQPYERYGDAQFTTLPRKPFDQYGPPPATTPLPFFPQQQQPLVDVAPMYRAPTERPHAYAPAMSYTENPVPEAYTTYTLNQQAKQQLQQFMPKEIQQQQQQQPQPQQQVAAPPTAGKIRTVQIVNPNAVKTLKVLETSDHAGVKTIKILGPSNESPMGEHRIVKVVSQGAVDGHDNHVQTVKIYNDHQDVAIGATATAVATGAAGNNAYLPPPQPAAVNKKRLVRDSRNLQAQPRRRIGSVSNNRRYRQRA